MKKIIYKYSWIAVLSGMLLSSCTKDFQETNTDPNSTVTALPQQLLAPALVNTLSLNTLRNRNFNNELMQVTVNMTDAEGSVFRYDYRSNFSDNLYNGWYSQLTNFKDIYKIASQPLNYNRSYMGISLICQAWLYSLLTDTYGDVPYSESNLARDSANYEPAFDRQKDIYLDIFKKLDTANVYLTTGTAIVGSSDPVYGGNVSRWRKFGNSLYLRLLLRISGKADVSAQCIAKIKEMIDTSPGTYPIINSTDESAILKWTGVAPYTNPLNTIREQDFRAVAMASYFMDNLVAWNDPRIDIPTYGTNSINRWGIAPYSGQFAGVPSGYTPGSNPIKKSYYYSNTSLVTLQTEPLAGMILNFAEVKLILAEAALKGWIAGSAETYYNDGANWSIKQWLPNWVVPIVTHLTAADMEWDNTLTFDEKMERIHKQKYYALYLADLQQWFEYRRTGHPVLPKGPGLRNNGVMPARMTYPIYVQSANPTNYTAAVAAQGPDLISTQVWWQKP
jgi:hypothetical protein